MKMFTASEIRLLRQSRHMKQKDLAVVLYISAQRYSILENNEDRPDERTIEILKALRYTEKTAREFLDAIP